MTSNPTTEIQQLTIAANGLRFHARAAGAPADPLVLLLHGFPESSFGWRHQLQPLAAAGYRAVAPDQRGYAGSNKPRGRRAYRIDALADDVIAIGQALGHDRFALVGHDWGGIVAWHLATHHAQHVERAAIINAPHLDVVGGQMLRHPSQVLRSAYVAAFQLPLLPERLLLADRGARLAAALQRSSRPGTFHDHELDVHRREWTGPQAMTSMLNWYRALPFARRRALGPVAPPVRVIWGDRDQALVAALAEASARLCLDAEVFHVADATHWIHHEEPALVNRLIVEFLGRGR